MARQRRSAAEAKALADLLDRVRDLHLTLSTDLTVAAAAVDAGEPEVARDIVAADCAEWESVSVTVPPPRRPVSYRRRALLTLPAIPLVGALAVTGAAAFTAVHHDSAHPAIAQPSPARHAPDAATLEAATSDNANATLRRLEAAVTRPSPAATVVAVASRLHLQLSRMIAAAPHDPQRLDQVQHLLALEQQLLESHARAGVAAALAASRHVTKLLERAEVPKRPQDATSPTTVPTPTATSTPRQQPTTTPTPRTTTSHPTSTHHVLRRHNDHSRTRNGDSHRQIVIEVFNDELVHTPI